MATEISQPAAGNKKMHRAWAMYDWANSAYNLVITSTIFPIYYLSVTKGGDGKVELFGHRFVNSSLLSYSIAFAYLVIACISPVLSSIADYKGNKKLFMRMFCYLGSVSCAGLYFFSSDTVGLGIACSTIAAIGYCGSIVFYNAYLPEIATENEKDRVSAQGFAYGYIGSVLLQLLCFVLIFKHGSFGWLGITDEGSASRMSFLLVGIWWFLFAHIPLARLPKGKPLEQHREHSLITNGFHELNKVLGQLKKLPVLRTYLGAFLFYSMGVQTVMLAAAQFGEKELNLDSTQLITTILIIQLVAIGGAYLMARLSAVFGNLRVLFGVVLFWIGICIFAYFVRSAMQFYLVATLVGIVMGGIQSLSRSTYAKLMPETRDTASFFSFYDVTEKIAIVIGMFSFGFIEELTGSMRNGITALIGFFVIGLCILYIAIRKAGRHPVAAVAAQ
ncbi:MAG: MFS transporter [Sphingobacteriales bacterium]|nr:MAG: MFS transporter [Sphingobacteriales bacterium]